MSLKESTVYRKAKAFYDEYGNYFPADGWAFLLFILTVALAAFFIL